MTTENNYKKLSFLQEVTQLLLNFIQGQFIIAILNGLIAGLGFWILKIDHAILLGILVGLLSLLPYIGYLISFTTAIVIAWLTHHNFWYLLGVLTIWLLLQVLETFLFQPKILGDKLKIHPLIVILAVIFWGAILGPWGAFLAIPLTAILQVTLKRILPLFKNFKKNN